LPPHPRSGAVVSCNEVFGGNSLQAELGLGHATRIVALELLWPKGKKVQRFENVPLDRIVVVEEGAAEPTLLPTPSPPPASK
jgi:hypothetical protein